MKSTHSKMTRHLSFTLALIVFVLLLTACGGSDDGSNTTEAAPDVEPTEEITPDVTEESVPAVETTDEAAPEAEANEAPEPTPALFNPNLGGSANETAGAQVYIWEDYGITFMLPEGWQGVTGGQDFDLALISPATAAGSADGAYLTFQYFPSVGQGTSYEAALEPVAEQVGGEVEPYTAGDLEGFSVSVEGIEGTNTVSKLILLPYGDSGAALYVQSVGTSEDVETINSILGQMVIEPPKPDFAAMDAAWSASLEDNGRLVYGDPDAPVNLIEFLSFTCGHCANFSHDIEKLIALEIEEGRAQIEIALLVGDTLAMSATKATYCATGQGKGYSAYKGLFQGYLTEGYQYAYSREGIDDLVGSIEGIDLDALNECIDSDAYDEQIAEIRMRFTDNGLTGTPTVLFGVDGDDPAPIVLPNGQVWSGSIPLSVLRMVLTRLIDEGIPLDQVLE